jgi:hypothetical protein
MDISFPRPSHILHPKLWTFLSSASVCSEQLTFYSSLEFQFVSPNVKLRLGKQLRYAFYFVPGLCKMPEAQNNVFAGCLNPKQCLCEMLMPRTISIIMSILFRTMHRISFWKQICKYYSNHALLLPVLTPEKSLVVHTNLEKRWHALYSILFFLWAFTDYNSQFTWPCQNKPSWITSNYLDYIRNYSDLLIYTWFSSRDIAELVYLQT